MARNASDQLSAPIHDVVTARGVMIPLRDGVKLATDLYFPAHNQAPLKERFPVVLTRTPYDKNRLATVRGNYYAARGYVAVMQDVRGRHESEGIFYPFRDEAPDGYDTLAWLVSQPWCNGRIGTLGESYEAGVQNALACLDSPGLAAMIPTYGASSYYHSSMRHNGALEMRFFIYAFMMAASGKEAAADPAVKAVLSDAYANIWEWVRAFPIRKGCTPLRLAPSYEAWAIDISTRAVYDEYWQAMGYGPLPYYDRHADVPTLYIGGWFDTYTRSTAQNFTELRKRKKTPVHMMIGPWEHGSRGTDAVIGDAFFPHQPGRPAYPEIHLRWFDRWLKDIPNGVEHNAPVEYFIMGGGEGLKARNKILPGGEWRAGTDWPPPAARATPFYFHGDGSLSREKPSAGPEQTTYLFDPSDPVPTIGGNLSAIPLKAGIFDQRQDARFRCAAGTLTLAARQDVVCFMTAPLDMPMEIAGPVEVVLHVATDGLDTDFTAKLIDFYPPGPGYPDGCAANLTDSIARLRFRDGYEKEHLAEPGRVYEFRFELYPTANRFMPGHVIRVDISSSNHPRFDVNPNTGGPLGMDRRRRIAENTLYHSAIRPSYIILPVCGESAPGNNAKEQL